MTSCSGLVMMHRMSLVLALILLNLAVAALPGQSTPATQPGDEAPRRKSIFDFGLEIGAPADDPDAAAAKPAPAPPAATPAGRAVAAPVPPPSAAPPVPAKVSARPPAGPAPTSPAPRASAAPLPEGPPETQEALRHTHVADDGTITVDKDTTFALKGTEGKSFVVQGELYLAPEPSLYGGGSVIFYLRQRNGTHRYELGAGGMRAKRSLLEGKVVPRFAAAMKLDPSPRETWVPFRIEVAAAQITARFGAQQAEAKGPLDTAGANLIRLGPGAKLRQLKVEVAEAPGK